MKILMTVKASADRDESCNDYTVEREFKYRLSYPPTPRNIQDRCAEVIAEYGETYPFWGRAPRTPVIDVAVREVDR